MNQRDRRLVLISALAGTASLIHELVWSRYLALLMGSTAYAVGTVTAVHMLGLALGEWLLGLLLARRPGLGRWVLWGSALLTALSPLLYRWADWLGLALSGGEVPGLFARVCLAGAALLPVSALMGGVLPALMGRCTGRGVNRIYTAQTAGGLLGAVLSGFCLIPALGLSASAVCAGLLCAAAAALLPGRSAVQGEEGRRQAGELACPAPRLRLAVLAAYLVSGFTCMAYQVYTTKLLTLFFRDSVYDFAVILAVFLACLAAGNKLAAVLSEKTAAPQRGLVLVLLGQGVLGLCSLFLINALPGMTQGLSSAPELYASFGAGYFWMGLLIKGGFTALLCGPAAVLWGMAFPFASAVFLAGREEKGAAAGVLLGANTLASAAGSLLSTFALLSLLGLSGALRLNGLLSLAAGVALLILVRTGQRKGRYARSACALAVCGGVLLALPAPWNRFELSTSFLVPGQDVEGSVEFLYYREDEHGVTSVVDFLPYGQKYLTTNRLYCQNTSGLTGAEDHRRLGYLPMLIHPDPQEVLVVGLGAGITLRGVAEAGEGAQIDCVEISGAVAEAAECFGEENGDVLERDNVHLIVEDARTYIRYTQKQYDLLIGDILFPMSSGSSGMFSLEYYEMCARRLLPGGMMVQWLPLHQFSQEELQTTIRTFAQVFPDTTLWLGMIGESVPVVGMVGTQGDVNISLEGLQGKYDSQPALAAELAQTAFDDPYMLLSHFITSVTPDAAFLEDAPLSRDDRPVLEYQNPTVTTPYSQRGRENLDWLCSLKESSQPLAWRGSDWDEELLAAYDAELLNFVGYFL